MSNRNRHALATRLGWSDTEKGTITFLRGEKMRSNSVFLLAILAVVFAYVGAQVALAPESDTLPILPTPDFSILINQHG